MKDIEAWLEKQKENIEKEYVFRPLPGTDITIAAEQAIRRANEGDRLVLAFNGAYIPVRKGCDANHIVDIYDAFIEKQKDASKAIEAVERIDKSIDEHLVNAYDMKDSNPDKKYYRGWDDALGKMAGILQDVYSDEKQKEPKQESGVKGVKGPQEIHEPSYDELQRHQDELYDFKVFAVKQAKEHHIRISFVHDFEWNNFCAGLLSYFNEKQKPADYNEYKMLIEGARENGKIEGRKEVIDHPDEYGLSKQKPAEWTLPKDFEEAVYKVANFISPFDSQEEFRKVSHRFAEQLLSLAKKELDKPTEIDEYKIIKKHITEDVLSSEVNKRLKECGWYVTDEKPAGWSEDFEENIRTLLHNKLTWHSEDGSMSSTVFIDDKTLKDIVSGIWFYVGKEALKYPNKEIHVQEWSEEDKKYLSQAIETLEHENYSILADKLKSLRPQSKEELAKMLQDEYNKGKELGEREGFTKGYNKGYKEGYKEANESIPYRFPVMPTTPSGFGCDGTHCTNPQMDCINCPIKFTGRIKVVDGINTVSSSGDPTLKAEWRPSEEQMEALKRLLTILLELVLKPMCI